MHQYLICHSRCFTSGRGEKLGNRVLLSMHKAPGSIPCRKKERRERKRRRKGREENREGRGKKERGEERKEEKNNILGFLVVF